MLVLLVLYLALFLFISILVLQFKLILFDLVPKVIFPISIHVYVPYNRIDLFFISALNIFGIFWFSVISALCPIVFINI